MRRKIEITVIVCLLSLSLCAQQVQVTAHADKSSVLLGEPLTITLKATIPVNQPIRFFTVDSIPHFEIAEKGKIDTLDSPSETVLTQQLTLISFDSGKWIIPPFILPGDLTTDSFGINIVYTQPFNENDPYLPIQGIEDIAEIQESSTINWWMFLLMVAGILLLLYWWRKSRKLPPISAVKVAASPFDAAIQAIDELEKSEHAIAYRYAAIIDVFRNYLQHTSTDSLQLTGHQLSEILKYKVEDNIRPLTEVLLLSDFVKYAKYIPAETELAGAVKAIKRTLHELETKSK